jgi:hypothetical protein
MSIEALPCIICGDTLKNVWEDAENQPSDGVACTTNGNYGSTVYDSILNGEFLEFNICDPCLVKAGEQGRIYTARTRRAVDLEEWGIIGSVSAPYVPVLWHQGLPGMEDGAIPVHSLEGIKVLGESFRYLEGLDESQIKSMIDQLDQELI